MVIMQRWLMRLALLEQFATKKEKTEVVISGCTTDRVSFMRGSCRWLFATR
jgi:hypothetical protein